MNFERDFLSNWSENLTPAEKSSFEPDLLETIQIGGERVFRKAWHSLDFDSDELHGWVAESGTDKHISHHARPLGSCPIVHFLTIGGAQDHHRKWFVGRWQVQMLQL
jgi:hypothetical protein